MTQPNTVPTTALQLRSLVKASGELELSLAEVAVAEPGPDDVVIRVDATPINPSDLGLLLGGADKSSFRAAGTKDRPVIVGQVPPPALRAMAARLDQSMPVGNEGAGLVVKAGASPAAQALLGKTVAGFGGEMFAQYRMLSVAQCLPLPEGTAARDGASCFVNPLTALAFGETMRAEGHQALVHTAAASNLGQMLVKICQKDNVALVNIVRTHEQADILKAIGATYVVDSTSPSFMEELTSALADTSATLGFDAIGGGPLAGQLLAAMEAAASRKVRVFSRYGSGQRTQVYVYGRLDWSPTIVPPDVGFAWNLGGFLLMPFLQKASAETRARMRQRVLDELKTTFASHYTAEISLADALDPNTLHAYNAKKTGAKFLINPNQGI